MRYAILLQQRPDDHYQASVPAIPGLTQVGVTRDATLHAIRQVIIDTVPTAELVYLDIPNQSTASPHLWLSTAGLFADDPTLDTLLQGIYSERDTE